METMINDVRKWHYQVYLIPDEHTQFQVDLKGGPDQVHLSGLPDSDWLA
jgi:hypothetical protein